VYPDRDKSRSMSQLDADARDDGEDSNSGLELRQDIDTTRLRPGNQATKAKKKGIREIDPYSVIEKRKQAGKQVAEGVERGEGELAVGTQEKAGVESLEFSDGASAKSKGSKASSILKGIKQKKAERLE
jgi:hypothetical protein